MRRSETPTRSTSLLLTATTLVAIAAMAAGARAVEGVPTLRTEAALSTGESRAVRAVAAVVAAAARDLLVAGHTAALPTDVHGVPVVAPARESIAPAETRQRGTPRLAARLLDLPPPRS